MPADGFSIRRAGPADLAALRRFEQGIIAAERPMDPTIRKGAVTYYDLDALVVSEGAFVAIAEQGGEAIGCGLVYRKASRSFSETEFHAYVGLMFVAPEHRGKGVSELIIGRLTEWARAQGLAALHLEVYPQNASAIRAYEKAGFAPYMLEMRAPLKG